MKQESQITNSLLTTGKDLLAYSVSELTQLLGSEKSIRNQAGVSGVLWMETGQGPYLLTLAQHGKLEHIAAATPYIVENDKFGKEVFKHVSRDKLNFIEILAGNESNANREAFEEIRQILGHAITTKPKLLFLHQGNVLRLAVAKNNMRLADYLLNKLIDIVSNHFETIPVRYRATLFSAMFDSSGNHSKSLYESASSDEMKKLLYSVGVTLFIGSNKELVENDVTRLYSDATTAPLLDAKAFENTQQDTAQSSDSNNNQAIVVPNKAYWKAVFNELILRKICEKAIEGRQLYAKMARTLFSVNDWQNNLQVQHQVLLNMITALTLLEKFPENYRQIGWSENQIWAHQHIENVRLNHQNNYYGKLVAIAMVLVPWSLFEGFGINDLLELYAGIDRVKEKILPYCTNLDNVNQIDCGSYYDRFGCYTDSDEAKQVAYNLFDKCTDKSDTTILWEVTLIVPIVVLVGMELLTRLFSRQHVSLFGFILKENGEALKDSSFTAALIKLAESPAKLITLFSGPLQLPEAQITAMKTLLQTLLFSSKDKQDFAALPVVGERDHLNVITRSQEAVKNYNEVLEDLPPPTRITTDALQSMTAAINKLSESFSTAANTSAANFNHGTLPTYVVSNGGLPIHVVTATGSVNGNANESSALMPKSSKASSSCSVQ